MQRRMYHDTGGSRSEVQAQPQEEYDGTKSKQAKRTAAAPAQSTSDGVMDMFDDFVKFMDEEFWLIFFAVIYAFTLIFFMLAVTNKIFGSKHAVWSWVIGLYIPWFVITTLYLIDPRLEQWSVAMVTKIYHRAQELRHREGLGGVKEAMAKWWKWRKEYKPPRVGNV
uniref:Uncharacterized protein n=1 Tax=Mantoniella antarctica TaxID=81844 RepID=A0A7S0SS17_9CHLO|mmetsp:Transcript_33782/g.85078  ORF Transcript_33782/g.85078 Transcript_33782/m.85078 type:complete len:167 (+) Transcript_33782:177-677(+)